MDSKFENSSPGIILSLLNNDYKWVPRILPGVWILFGVARTDSFP
jgi:hypothetical protein